MDNSAPARCTRDSLGFVEMRLQLLERRIVRPRGNAQRAVSVRYVSDARRPLLSGSSRENLGRLLCYSNRPTGSVDPTIARATSTARLQRPISCAASEHFTKSGIARAKSWTANRGTVPVLPSQHRQIYFRGPPYQDRYIWSEVDTGRQSSALICGDVRSS